MGVRITPEGFAGLAGLSPLELKSARKRLGLTGQELATLLGVSISTVSRWETGKSRPSKLASERLRTVARKARSKNHG